MRINGEGDEDKNPHDLGRSPVDLHPVLSEIFGPCISPNQK